MSVNRIKILRANLATFQARLATTMDKDQVRRQIAATKALLREEILKEGQS